MEKEAEAEKGAEVEKGAEMKLKETMARMGRRSKVRGQQPLSRLRSSMMHTWHRL